MARILKRIAFATALSVAILAQPLLASAQDVMVLGLRSLEGDDSLALSLTGALRHGASQVPGWQVADREVSLDQMSLAFGCETPDEACLAQIAETLDAQLLIYGTIQRTSGEDGGHDFAVVLRLYDAEANEVAGSVTDTIPRVQSDIDNLRGRVRQYIGRLTGTLRGGSVRIHVNVPEAQVRVDGEIVGPVARGHVDVDLDSGDHEVVVSSPGYEPFRQSISISDGAEHVVEATLMPESVEVVEPSGVNWPAYATLGVSALSFGMAIFSMTQVDCIGAQGALIDGLHIDLCDDDPDLRMYREAFDPDVGDVCDLAASDTSALGQAAADACDSGDVWSALQWVFLGVGAASGAVGIYLLASGGDDAESEPETGTSFSVRPSVRQDGGRVTATVSF